jgi:hypothetical protein
MPKGLKKDLCEMKVQKTAHLRAIRELESQMLKGVSIF